VPNRRAFDDRLQREVARCGVDGLPVSVAMVDVDCFKQFNDAHGHVAGDGALRQVGRVLNNAIRGYDFVARYGGEEFAVILPGLDLKSARAVTDRLREAVESAVWEYRPVTISIGVATTSAPRALGKSAPAKLLDQADAALYEAKRGGRNRVVAFEVESGHAAACVHL
ncbi:GGDEF domain-containing protein, partial [bacterium]